MSSRTESTVLLGLVQTPQSSCRSAHQGGQRHVCDLRAEGLSVTLAGYQSLALGIKYLPVHNEDISLACLFVFHFSPVPWHNVFLCNYIRACLQLKKCC